MNGEWMAAEIKEQPHVLERILREGRTHIVEVARAIRAQKPRFALFVARGTSDHAALYAKYLTEVRLGLPSGLVSPSTFTVYEEKLDPRDTLFVAVSQSGGSPDLLEPLAQARESGAITLAVTNAPESPLAEAAEHSIDVLAGEERAVAATKSYTAELFTLYLLIEAMAGNAVPEAEAVPDYARAALSCEDRVGKLAVRYRFAEQLVITARGYNYPTARESALKLMETSYIVASAFSGADLLHGPMAMIDRGFPVIAIAPGGPGSSALVPVLQRLRDLGADTLVVGDRATATLGTVSLPLPALGSEIVSPILTILPMQQFAWFLTRERGGDPDQPRGLSKVTRTW